jgi:hypothetical protein
MKLHAQVLAVPLDGLLGVLAAVGDVVHLLGSGFPMFRLLRGRRLQGLAQHADVADVVGQQQDQAGVEQFGSARR